MRLAALGVGVLGLGNLPGHAADFKFKAPFEYNAIADSLGAMCQNQQIASQVARIDDSANFVTCRR
jgi:hypothetical protein